MMMKMIAVACAAALTATASVAAEAAPWWKNRPAAVFEFSEFHGNMIRWRDGTVGRTGPTNGGGFRIGAKETSMRKATFYDAATGACAPRKSYIATGPVRNVMIGFNRLFAYSHVQLCDSDGKATRPFIDVPTPADPRQAPTRASRKVSAPVKSFGRR